MKELNIESSKHSFSVDIDWIAVIVFISLHRVFYLSSFNVMCRIFNVVTQTFWGTPKCWCYEFVNEENLTFGYSHLNWCFMGRRKSCPYISKKHFIKMCGRLIAKIHTFSAGWRRVVCFMFWPLSPCKRAPYIHQRGNWACPSTSLDALTKRSPYPNHPKSMLSSSLKSVSSLDCYIPAHRIEVLSFLNILRFSVHIILFTAYPHIFLGVFATLWCVS
jgi:hypothetical protein